MRASIAQATHLFLHPRPASETQGVIAEIGPGVTIFQKGQAVFGRSTQGAYAEYTTTAQVVKRGGTLVSVLESPPLAQERGIRAIRNATLPTSDVLRTIARLIDEGHARPTIRQSFALDQAPLAHELCQTGHGRGRIVLHIAD